jgi:hypothetical protein
MTRDSSLSSASPTAEEDEDVAAEVPHAEVLGEPVHILVG